MQANIPSVNGFNDKLAFSIIATAAGSTYFFGKICVKNYVSISDIGTYQNDIGGAALVMQMRGWEHHDRQ